MSYVSEVLADSPLFYSGLDQYATISAVTSSSQLTGGGEATNAFDNGINTWTTNATTTGWLRAQLSTATVETAYAIRRRDDFTTRNPNSWTFEGSNDGTTWTTLDTRSGITWPTAGETKNFTFTNTTAYSYYRINVTANNGDASYLSIRELSLSTVSLWDASGNGHHGVIALGTGSLRAGSLLTDGSGSSIQTAGVTGTNHTLPWVAQAAWMETSTFTVEAIIKPSSVTGQHVIIARDDLSGVTGNRHSVLYMNGSALAGSVHTNTNESNFTASGALSIGATYHVAMTFDGTTVRAYLNGSLCATTITTSGALNTTSGQPLTIGFPDSENWPFAGQIAHAAYYGAALSGTRIAAHATAATTSGTAASGTGSLSLSGAGGTAAPDTGSAALSLSASGSDAATAGASGSLSVSGSGSVGGTLPASGSAALALSASGGDAATASGSAALIQLAAGGAAGDTSGTGSISLSGSGGATSSTSASGSGSLTLTLVQSFPISSAAALVLSGGGIAYVLYETDTSNAFDGLDLLLTARVIFAVPIATPPTSLATKYDKALAYPTPTMVGGRPT